MPTYLLTAVAGLLMFASADAADLVCGKTSRSPAALIRNYTGIRGEGAATEMVRSPGEDLFR